VLVGPVTDDKLFKALFETRSTHLGTTQKQKDEPELSIKIRRGICAIKCHLRHYGSKTSGWHSSDALMSLPFQLKSEVKFQIRVRKRGDLNGRDHDSKCQSARIFRFS
jgi:hypothetical protein